MHIVISSAGSRGDLQPYVALGQGLLRAGHAVTVASHAHFEAFVRAHGLNFRPLAGDPREVLLAEGGQSWLETGNNPLAFLLHCAKLIAPLFEPMMEALQAAVCDADIVIYGPLTYPAADFAEARGIFALMASPVPLSPTGDFPFMVFPPDLQLGPLANYAIHQVVLHVASLGSMNAINPWRRRLGLQPLPFGALSYDRQQVNGALYGFSEHVLPRPADWGAHLDVTGYWFVETPTDFTPPPALVKFLAAGPPPVYVGFGSMIGRNPGRLAGLVYTALERAGQRGVMLGGWAGVGDGSIPDHVCVVDDVPHDWLFPRMAAVVHHGGAGTTAAGLRSGVPSVVAPFFADQPFWGARVQALGVGPAPVPQVSLTVDQLAFAIRRAVSDPDIRARAADLGSSIRAEDGVARAIEVIERGHAAFLAARRGV